jgi:hypothetical protein
VIELGSPRRDKIAAMRRDLIAQLRLPFGVERSALQRSPDFGEY